MKQFKETKTRLAPGLTMIVCALFAVFAFSLLISNIAYADPAYTYAYVVNVDSNTISVIDTTAHNKVTDIHVSGKPDDIAINPAGTLLYVSYDGLVCQNIEVFSTIDYSKIAAVQVTTTTTAQYARLSMNDKGTILYVTLSSDGKVVAIDTATNTIMATSTAIINPWPIKYYNNYVYVADYTNNLVYKLNPDTLATIDTVAGVTNPHVMDVDRTNNRLVVGNDNGSVTGISLSTFETSGLYVYAATGYTYGITTNNSGYVFTINSSGKVGVLKSDYSLIASYPVASPIGGGITYNNYNHTLFIAGFIDNNLYIVNADTGTIITQGYIGSKPYHVIIGTQAYASTHLVKIVVQGLFGIYKYDNVNISIYDDQDILQQTGCTDNTGQIAFYLNPIIKYKVHAESMSDNIDTTIYVYPYDEIKYIDVLPFIANWNPLGWYQNANQSHTGPGTGDINKDIVMNYSVNTGSTPRIITINYSDATATTSNVNFTLLRWWTENGTYTVYNTTIVAGSGMGFQQMPISVPANLADGQSWQIVVTSSTTSYGTVKRQDTYRFPGASYPIPGMPADWYPLVCFGLTFLVAIMFTSLSVGVGLIVIGVMNVVFMLMGWLAWSDTYMLLFQVLAVLGAGQIFKMKRQREGF